MNLVPTMFILKEQNGDNIVWIMLYGLQFNCVFISNNINMKKKIDVFRRPFYKVRNGGSIYDFFKAYLELLNR